MGSLLRDCRHPAARLKSHEIRPIGCAVSHTLRTQAGQRGRHRYYRLADDEVAHALETVALIAKIRTPWHTAQISPHVLTSACEGRGGQLLEADGHVVGAKSQGIGHLFNAPPD